MNVDLQGTTQFTFTLCALLRFTLVSILRFRWRFLTRFLTRFWYKRLPRGDCLA